jgi:hypothetical protein
MSAESKQRIIDRLNGRGQFARPRPIDAVVGGPAVPGAYDPGFRNQTPPAGYDPKNPKLLTQQTNQIELRQVLGTAPTFFIYDLVALCEEILSQRPDAKR